MFKKVTKKIIASILAFTLMCGGINLTTVSAAEDIKSSKWTVAKNVATADTTSHICKLTLYTGTIKFRASDMTDNISSVAARCVGYNVTIKNNKIVRVTRPKIDATFNIDNNSKEYMKFKVFLETNATYYQYAFATGKIYY